MELTPVWHKGRLAETAEAFALHSLSENQVAAKMLCTQAHNTLQIYSPDLDPRVLNDTGIASAIGRLARSGRRARVEILISEASALSRSAHALLPLIQRLTSHLEVRVLPDEHEQVPWCFLIADGCGLLYRSLSSEYEAELHFNNRALCNEKLRWFEEQWQQSRIASELRRLHL